MLYTDSQITVSRVDANVDVFMAPKAVITKTSGASDDKVGITTALGSSPAAAILPIKMIATDTAPSGYLQEPRPIIKFNSLTTFVTFYHEIRLYFHNI